MKWPLLDVPGSAGLKDSRSPTPGHLVSAHEHYHTAAGNTLIEIFDYISDQVLSQRCLFYRVFFTLVKHWC